MGGQALNVWVEAYAAKDPDLTRQGPFTSKDIDFQGDRQAVKLCADRLKGKPYIPSIDEHTPNTGTVVYHDEMGEKQSIDFIEAPLGLKGQEVRRFAIPFDVLDDRAQPTGMKFLVMHPVHCLESRVHNVIVLGATQKQLSQLRVAIAVTRHFLRHLLDTGRRRDVLRLNERIFKFCLRDLSARDVVTRHGIDPFAAVLLDDRLGKFSVVRYPEMKARLQRKRGATPGKR